MTYDTDIRRIVEWALLLASESKFASYFLSLLKKHPDLVSHLSASSLSALSTLRHRFFFPSPRAFSTPPLCPPASPRIPRLSQSVPGNTTSRVSRVLKRLRGLQKAVAMENRYSENVTALSRSCSAKYNSISILSAGELATKTTN